MPYTILIADHNQEMRSRVRSLLKGAGWQVVGEASDGQEAIDMARRLLPGLVIADLSMPTRNGLEIAAEILQKLPGTKILIFTIHEAEEIRRKVLQAGVHGYALKNSSGADLIAEVKRLLGTDE